MNQQKIISFFWQNIKSNSNSQKKHCCEGAPMEPVDQINVVIGQSESIQHKCKLNNIYKYSCSVEILILGMEPKFHANWSKNRRIMVLCMYCKYNEINKTYFPCKAF